MTSVMMRQSRTMRLSGKSMGVTPFLALKLVAWGPREETDTLILLPYVKQVKSRKILKVL